MAPDVVSLRLLVLANALTLVAIAATGLLSSMADWTWGTIYTAKNTFLFGCVLFLAGGQLSSIFLSQSYFDFSERTVLITGIYCILGTICFLIGYASKGTRLGAGVLALMTRNPSGGRLWFSAVCLAGIATYSNVRLELSGVPLSALERSLWFHPTQLYVPAGGLLAALLVRLASTLAEKMVAAILLAPIIMIHLFVWSRRPAQAIVLALLAYYSFVAKLSRKRQVQMVALAALLAFFQTIVQGEYRSLRARTQGELSLRYVEDYIDSAGGFLKSGKLIDTYDMACFTIEIFPQQRSYLYGDSIWALIVNPIPRRFWPEKPVGFGYTLALEMLRTNRPTTNFGPSIIGEFYANGGILALALGMAFIGFLCKSYDSLLLGEEKSECKLLIHVTGLYHIFFAVRGDFLDAGYQFLISVVPVFLLLAWPAPTPPHSSSLSTRAASA